MSIQISSLVPRLFTLSSARPVTRLTYPFRSEVNALQYLKRIAGWAPVLLLSVNSWAAPLVPCTVGAKVVATAPVLCAGRVVSKKATPKTAPLPPAKPFPATVLSLQGQAWVLAESANATPNAGMPSSSLRSLKLGDTLNPGMVLRIGPQSFISLAMGDGNKVVLPAHAEVVLREVSAPAASAAGLSSRRNTSSPPSSQPAQPRTIARFELRQGAVESYVRPATAKAPATLPSSLFNTFEVQTPGTVLGVRGTHFRVWWGYKDIAVESANAINSIAKPTEKTGGAELLEGKIIASTERGETLLMQPGFGLALSPDKLNSPVALLAAPTRLTQDDSNNNNSELPDRPNAELGWLRMSAVNGAVLYKAQVARDPSFLDILQERVSSKPQLVFDNLASGLYNLRLTAIAADGMEGMTSDSVWIHQPTQPQTNGVKFLPNGSVEITWPYNKDALENTRYRFDMSRDTAFTQWVLHESDVSTPGLTLPSLASGSYFWRVHHFTRLADGSVQERPGAQGSFVVTPTAAR